MWHFLYKISGPFCLLTGNFTVCGIPPKCQGSSRCRLQQNTRSFPGKQFCISFLSVRLLNLFWLGIQTTHLQSFSSKLKFQEWFFILNRQQFNCAIFQKYWESSWIGVGPLNWSWECWPLYIHLSQSFSQMKQKNLKKKLFFTVFNQVLLHLYRHVYSFAHTHIMQCFYVIIR